MTHKICTLLALACAGVIAAPAAAKEKPPVFVTAAPVKDKPAVSLDPAQGHVMVRAHGTLPLYLMRIPSAEDAAAYRRLRDEAFATAREKYAKRLASYQRQMKAFEDQPKGTPGAQRPETPVEPTEANFEFTPFEMLTGVAIGPLNRFAKAEGGGSTYLHALTPGSYRVYGLINAAQNGAMTGVCYCMGSVGFDVRAGEITDLGHVKLMPATEVDLKAPVPPLFEPATMPLDPRLASATVRPAAFRPVGKLPNYFGLTISRVGEMPGVLRYDRDRIVDLTAAR